MLAAAVEAAGIAGLFDAVLSVDAVRLYKPRPEVYALVTDALAVEPSDVAFVSSNRWDVMGAVSFGFNAFWVNRARMPDEYADLAPLREIPDLAALPNASIADAAAQQRYARAAAVSALLAATGRAAQSIASMRRSISRMTKRENGPRWM